MKTSIRLAIAAAIVITTAIPFASSLAKDRDHDAALTALRQGEILPLTDILGIAAKREPGTVIKVELETKRQFIYEIKVLTDKGRVRELKIDARTGEILKIEDD